MFSMNPHMLCFTIELCLEYCLYNYLKHCIMGNLSISTNFIVPSMVNYQDGQQISMYLSVNPYSACNNAYENGVCCIYQIYTADTMLDALLHVDYMYMY